MQRFVSDAVWDESKLLHKYHRIVNEDMGDPNGVLILMNPDSLKKVTIPPELQNSIAVIWVRLKIVMLKLLPLMRLLKAMPYWISGYLFRRNGLVTITRLRRDKCKIPKDVELKTKPQLAVEMFHYLQNRKVIPS